MLLLAVVATAGVAGRGPALFATGLSFLAAWIFFVEPRYSLAINHPRDLGDLVLLAITGIVASLLRPAQGGKSRPGEVRSLTADNAARFRRAGLLAGVLLLLLAMTFALSSDLDQERTLQAKVSHTYDVLNESRGVLLSLESADASLRGYLLTGDASYLEPYTSSLPGEQAARGLLRRLTVDNPRQRARLDIVDRLAVAKVSELTQVAALAREGRYKEAVSLVAGTEKLQLVSSLRSTLAAVEREERQLLAERSARAGAQSLRMRWILGLGSGSLLLLLMVAGAIIERDVREREATRRILHENEDRLRIALTAANAGAWEWDLDTGQVVWSEEIWNVYGLQPHSCQPSYEAWLQVVHPDDRERVVQMVFQSTNAGNELSVEYRVANSGSVPRWLLIQGQPVREEGGPPRRYLGIALDITERKRAEEAVRESENQFRTLANAIPQLCWMADAGGHIFWYNQRWYDYTGVTQELTNQPGWESIHDPSVLPGVKAAWQESLATGSPFDMVFPLRSFKGEFRPFLTRVMPVLDREGRVARWFGTNTDISEQQRTENALRESEGRFAFALGASQIGHWEFDLANHSAHRSIEHARIFGHPDPSAPWTFEDFLNHVVPEDRESIANRIRAAIESDGNSNFECRITRADGAVRWIWVCGQLRREENGGARRMAGIIQDITERKHAERRIRQINVELEQRVQERTSELQASNKELEAFAYSVSHDLRAPLRGIDGWSLALLEDYGAQLDQNAQRYLSRVRSEAQRLGTLIDDLLQLSRITRDEMQRATVDLSAVAGAVAERLLESHPDRRIEFTIAPGLMAAGDPRLLEIALTNLFGNAVKFTARRADPQIEFNQISVNGETAFRVRDNGVGFDMTYAHTLFGAFQRLHKPSDFPGSGIGLATVQRIIRRHGGRVWAEAQPDQGATFYFTIGPPKRAITDE